MANLYLANCTKQLWKPQVRIAERRDIYMKPIAPGTQVLYWQENAVGQIAQILAQLEPIGAIAVDAVPSNTGFTGLAYSIDREIKVDSFMVADEQNHGVLVERGKQLRTDTALVTREILSKHAQSVGAHVNNCAATVLEDIAAAKRPHSGAALSETVRIHDRAA